MRLTVDEQNDILRIVRRHLGDDNTVRLYGSRIHDDRRGGDVDLLIEANGPLPPLARADLQLDLEAALQYPVDILYHQMSKTRTPFQRIARTDSLPIQDRLAGAFDAHVSGS